MSDDRQLLTVENLQKHFPIRSGFSLFQSKDVVRAVDGVSFSLNKGETFGLVGEFGCGKSTLGRTVMQLYRPTAGKVNFMGNDITAMQGKPLREVRRNIQMIFQDPYSSLNPRMTIGDSISEPLEIYNVGNKKEKAERVEHLLSLVGLNNSLVNRYPHEFSGGQRQRCGIARALALEPSLVICDEPISALDVSIQAQIINLLRDLQVSQDLAYLFISHDLSVVRYISDRVGVMYLGVMVEMAECDGLYTRPMHPYTHALLSSSPIANPIKERQRKSVVLEGDIPSPVHPPSGCRFRTRCAYATTICTEQTPELLQYESGHWAACHNIK